MEQKHLIIICITAIICTGLLSFTALTLHNNQVENDSNISNDSVNLTLNDSHNNTTNTSTTQKTYQTTKKSSSSKSSGSEDSWGDYEDDEWVYGHGAGSSDDSDIQWRHNKKTGYSKYYNTKTQESWGGYDIA